MNDELKRERKEDFSRDHPTSVSSLVHHSSFILHRFFLASAVNLISFHKTMIIILMGVAGSGKTTNGSVLAEGLGWSFFDGEDFHPPENIAKMSSGIALTDSDRVPWLQALADLISNLLASKTSAVLACSALKSEYRDRLKGGAGSNTDQIRFVYLKVSPSVAHERLRKREGHFMPEELISSQFETLEEPDDAIVADASLSPDEVVAEIRQALEL